MIQIIDRYIAKLFLAFFFGGLVVFATLYLTVDFMTNMVKYNAPTKAVLEYYSLYTPDILYRMLPVACLLSTIFTLSTLNKNNELVALFSSGMSLARVSAPILTLIVLISSVSFWLNDRVMPIVNQRKNYVLYVEIKKTPGLYSTVKTGRIWYRSGNVLFNIKTLQPDKGTAQGLTMYYFDSAWRLIQMITAREVKLLGSNWELEKGSVTLFGHGSDAERGAESAFSEDGADVKAQGPKKKSKRVSGITADSGAPMTKSFDAKTISVSEDVSDIQATGVSTDSLNLSELKRYIKRNKEAGLETLRYEVDYYAKYSFAFAAFVMSFLGIPFSVTRQRAGGSAFNVGITILLAFGYWAAYSSGITLGRHGALPPLLAVSVPNIAMAALSLIFLLRLKR